jgi:hypothetical protein
LPSTKVLNQLPLSSNRTFVPPASHEGVLRFAFWVAEHESAGSIANGAVGIALLRVRDCTFRRAVANRSRPSIFSRSFPKIVVVVDVVLVLDVLFRRFH